MGGVQLDDLQRAVEVNLNLHGKGARVHDGQLGHVRLLRNRRIGHDNVAVREILDPHRLQQAHNPLLKKKKKKKKKRKKKKRAAGY